MFHRYSIRGGIAALPVVLAASGVTSLAAQTGAVTGTVTDATTGRPLEAATVSLAATVGMAVTGTSGPTDAAGRYRFGSVPPGRYTLRAVITGYRTRETDVTVSADDTRIVDFRLAVSAIDLGRRVGVGPGVSAERRRVGASLPVLDAGPGAVSHPVVGFSQLLEGRMPGVRSVGTNGGVGAGRELVIRGIDSFGYTGQRPVVYLDGVRIDTEKTEWGDMPNVTCCLFSGGAGEDRLSDINPQEIDRVEVLKGPAAAALYGSEASAGVIEVFTKRGRRNMPTTFTLNAGLGVNRLRPNLPTRMRSRFRPNGFAPWDPNQTLIEAGPIASYNLTARGGSEDAAYFVSAGLTRQEGSVKPNDQSRANLRVSLDWAVGEDLTVRVTSGHVRNRIRALQSGDNWLGVYTNAMLSDPRRADPEKPYGGGLDVSVADAQAIRTASDTDRWTTGVEAEYRPTPNVVQRLTIGLDRVTEQKNRHLPSGRHYNVLGSMGERSRGFRWSEKFTGSYLVSYTYSDLFGLGPLDGTLSAGGQSTRDKVQTTMGVGRGLRGGLPISAAERTFSEGRFSELINLGFFVHNRVDLTDDLAVTGSLRLDWNSAFGEYYGSASYPSVALAYDLPRSLLPAAISTLRVRAATGRAGKPPPSSFTLPPYVRTVVLDDKPGVRYVAPPSSDIGPENKRESEAGLDVGLLEDRIGFELTYYDARTVNALNLLPTPASRGVHGRVENCCEIVNRGVEAALAATPVNRPSLLWRTNLAYEWNRNRITDLGPRARADSVPTYRQNEDGMWEFVRWEPRRSLEGWFEGQSVGDILAYGIAGHDRATNAHSRTAFRFNRGRVRPTHVGSVFNSFQLGSGLMVSIRLRGEMGAVMRNSGRRFGVQYRAHDEYLKHLDEDGEPTYAADSVYDFHKTDPIDKRDHLRLQEVSLSYTVPRGTGVLTNLEGATFTLSGYNLYWWDDCNCPDPGQQYRADDFDTSPFMALPQPRRFLLSVRTTF